MEKTTVALLCGGQNNEHEISLTSARSVLNAIDTSRFVAIPIWIRKTGEWFWLEDPAILAANKDQVVTPQVFEGQRLTSVVFDYSHHKTLLCLNVENKSYAPFARKIDVFFPILHGPYGEDGTIQGLLQLADVPYVGCGVMASAIGLDKVAMKSVFAQAGLPQCDYLHFTLGEWQSNAQKWQQRVADELGFPCFVKPATGGSSVGVCKVKQPQDLADAIYKAGEVDRKIVVEKGIAARELECAVLGNESPEASVVGEILPAHEFYDYEAKYFSDKSQTIAPADIPKEISERIREMSLIAFRAIGGAGLSRVDFLWQNDSDIIYINEINTLPGFTTISMFPMLWKECGISYSQLITRLIDFAKK